MKILFMGTPDIAASVMKALLEAGHEIVLAVTQPDREKGRGKGLAQSPVKELAEAEGIPVFQPERIRRPEAQAELRALLAETSPEVGVVVAFGQILPQEVLDLPKHGCINVHASLLPKYRGAAPIQWAVLDGCEKSGVTTMQMDAGLDTGDILLQREIVLDARETGGSLFDKMTVLGGELICETLELLEQGSLTRTPQEGESNYASMLKKEMGEIDWSWPAEKLDRWVRGLFPWPGSFTFRKGKLLKLLEAEAVYPEIPANACPGSVLSWDKTSFTVACGEGTLRILKVQPEGKKAMTAGEYLRGAAMKVGERLGR